MTDELPPDAVIDREIGLRARFFDFVEMTWPRIEHGDIQGWHIEVICDRLEALAKGDVRNLVVNVPPGTGKSTITCVLWPIWCWLREPRASILTLSISHDIVVRDASKSVALIRSDWFRERWGDVVAVAPSAGVLRFDTVQGGHREAATFGGQIVGKHPDIVVIDDPLKSNDVTPATIEDAERTWRNALSTRAREPRTLRRACIMQRLHVKDLAGVFIAAGWNLLRLPMRFEASSADPFDRRKVEGELLVPERFPEEAVRERETALGSRGSAAQLQQRPFPEGGAIFKRDWLRWYDPETMTYVDKAGAVVKLPPITRRLSSWDLAFKDEQTSDYVAGQVWGLAGPLLIGLDGIRERLDFVASIAAIVNMRAKWPDATATLIEDKANGPAVMNMLRGKLTGIIAVEPQGGKVARANAASPVVEAGNVFLPRGRKWAEDLAESLAAFPVGEWDDDVDAFTQLVLHVQRKGIDYDAAMKALGGMGRSLLG